MEETIYTIDNHITGEVLEFNQDAESFVRHVFEKVRSDPGIMSSKRHQRKRQCESKRRYPDESAASHARWLMYQKQYRGYMNVYKCKFCGGFHIGTAPHRGRKRKSWKV